MLRHPGRRRRVVDAVHLIAHDAHLAGIDVDDLAAVELMDDPDRVDRRAVVDKKQSVAFAQRRGDPDRRVALVDHEATSSGVDGAAALTCPQSM